MFISSLSIRRFPNRLQIPLLKDLELGSTSDESVLNVLLGEDNFRVQVMSVKDLEALVPIPVEDEIVTVRDALGTYLAWPKISMFPNICFLSLQHISLVPIQGYL